MAKSIIFFAKYYVLIVVKSEKLLTQRYVYVANQLLLLNILYEKIYMSYISKEPIFGLIIIFYNIVSTSFHIAYKLPSF